MAPAARSATTVRAELHLGPTAPNAGRRLFSFLFRDGSSETVEPAHAALRSHGGDDLLDTAEDRDRACRSGTSRPVFLEQQPNAPDPFHSPSVPAPLANATVGPSDHLK